MCKCRAIHASNDLVDAISFFAASTSSTAGLTAGTAAGRLQQQL